MNLISFLFAKTTGPAKETAESGSKKDWSRIKVTTTGSRTETTRHQFYAFDL
jgi:hypothetical protein